MSKIFIRNRSSRNISVFLEKAEEQRGLVFIMHGLGGFKEQPHIRTYAQVFKQNNFSVITFDTINSVGESGGEMAEATLTNYYEDLEDVIAWAKTQDFFQEPFVLAGHSLGSFCIVFYAENNPQKVKAIAPTSAVVSGSLLEETTDFKEVADEWKKKGIREWESSSQPGVIKRLKWSHVEDRRKYNLLPLIDKIKIPVLMIVGEMDDVTPVEHQTILFNALTTKEKEFYIIKGASHTFKYVQHLNEIKGIFDKWIKKI